MGEQGWEKIGDALREVSQDFDFDSSGRIVVHDPRLLQIVRDRTGKGGIAERFADVNYVCPENAYCPKSTRSAVAEH